MGIEFVFKVAGVGLIVAVLNMIVGKSGRDEQALLVTIAGLIVVLALVIPEIGNLFESIKAVFGL
ncbi:MAG: stage III sporulation protein AC [Clostridia bacterium]|nr:stage III sporulation protein AC [Clostridia bacterium]